MVDPIVFMEIGNVLVNVAHIASVEYFPCEEIGNTVFNEKCDIRTTDGKTYLFFGTKEDFLAKLYEVYRKAGCFND